ncbi:aminopeptidase [Clostridium estertheticum]|uniref:Aminopeptidase n=1 Tax=Clostridium estertheticum TaxID=238834 RepID=A0AA47EFR2_9CLOT|nr:aminopeptidase [Clostridium estertheticum]MBU3156170.1 aminopeptidase [Clostridium estertheticum]MBU3199401.1 aminopeptidase [Clostridium estertheticum]WAG58609.1 aminopeptidase [Clostridium estertheticum]WAG67355.1 aminopeptidase [Clostridium estertheticum]
MDNKLLEKYALLLVKTGINIQKDQTLVINSPIECAAFTRIVSRIAYLEGAREVVVTWRDELSTKIKFMFAPEEIFSEYPDWQRDFYVSSARKGAAFLSISASDPELMKDVNPDRLSKSNKAASTAIKEYRDRMMSNKNVWCVASIPTQAWANKVFPKFSEGDAIEKLWNAIFKTVRVDALDPVASWETHKSNLKKSMDYLNLNNFKYLQYKNSLGTDLKIELPENHLWLGGSDYTPGGVEFIANMPTEEVFTLPKKTGVNGTVVSSKPLNYNGNLIENFSLTFEKGKVVDFKAETGYDILKSIIETDEGSCYLGEVALVPYDSPISNSNILFYNTLFDENASCHLALGKAYPVCIKNGENLSNEELSKLEVNDSFVHEDFMVGTEDLQIIGITADGKEVSVFEKGNFAF